MIGCEKPTCDHEVEVSSSCTALSSTTSCKENLINHCQTNNTSQNLSSEVLNLIDGTKEAMLNFLKEQKSKTAATKIKIITSFHQTIHNLIKEFEVILKEIDSDSTKFRSYFEKVLKTEQMSRLDQDPILNLLALQSHHMKLLKRLKKYYWEIKTLIHIATWEA